MIFPTHIVSAAGFVENEDGYILLVKTRDDGWVFPGGIIEVGENVIDGLKREIYEESGIVADVLQLVNVISNTMIHKWHDGVTDVPTKVMFDFTCKAIDGQLTTSDETSEVIWVAKDKALDYITLPPIRVRYESYLAFKGQAGFIDYTTPNKAECHIQLQRTV